eukprot:scaffold88666_cov53-Phaeocystis_antarctica.AAC.4
MCIFCRAGGVRRPHAAQQDRPRLRGGPRARREAAARAQRLRTHHAHAQLGDLGRQRARHPRLRPQAHAGDGPRVPQHRGNPIEP